MNCDEARPLLHALIDGELDAVHAREVEVHVAGCARCAAELAAYRDMHGAFSNKQVQFAAPAGLRRRIEASLPAPQANKTSRRSVLKGFAFGTALTTAIAASALFVVVREDQEQRVASELVSAHLRSLQGDHLTDVLSSDQHSVKPWFNGRLDVAPPVVDLTTQGFTLIGGRLDYIDGKPVAVIVYKRRNHIINLFVAPAPGVEQRATGIDQVQGFTVRRWTAAGLSYSAVSDLGDDELQEFTEKYEAGVRTAG